MTKPRIASLRPLLTKRRIVGLVLIAILLTAFLITNRFPKLEVVREDLAAVAATSAQCFQGFCVENDPDTGFIAGWWDFSFTYLKLVAVGMTFAMLVAGLTEAFLFPAGAGGRLSGRGLKGALQGLMVGTPMTLCSACIVPISSAFRRKGAGVEATIAMAQSSSTLNLPAIIMAATVFTPLLFGSRLVLGIIGALLLGPLVALLMGRRGRSPDPQPAHVEALQREAETWGEVLRSGMRDWLKASIRYLIALGPLMVAASLITGLVIQFIKPETISIYLGDNVTGIAIAATVGVLINVPLMFEIPLVAALLLVGMGTAPAATLLFAAAAGGPLTFWGLAKVLPKKAIAAFGTATWALGALGGLAVLGLAPLLPGPPLAGMEVQAAVTDGARATGSDGQGPRGSLLGAPARLVFTDVTEEAGLMYRQYALRPDGSCLLALGPNEYLPGEFCLPERMSGGAAAGDFDNDGHIDLYVTRLDAPDILFRNTGTGRFVDVSAESGLGAFDLRSNGAVWADIDNDGDLDLYVTTISDTRFYLFVNDGAGGFTEQAIPRGAAIETAGLHVGYSIGVGDYDLDGWLDLHVTEWGSSSQTADDALMHARLLRNLGPRSPGYFEDVTVRAGVVLDDVQSQVVGGSGGESVGAAGPWTGKGPEGPFAFASTFVDLDSDGWPDLAVASDFGTTRIFWNNGDGTFLDGTMAARIGTDKNGMGSTFGDYDGDGDLDWFVTSIYREYEACQLSRGCDPRDATGNRLYRNEGGRLFHDATDEVGVRNGGWGWGAVFLDYDNDGDLDLIMVNGMHDSDDLLAADLGYTRLWENTGPGQMLDVSQSLGLSHADAGKGLLTFDYDRDGDLDLFIVNNGSTPRLYRNDGGNFNSWLRVKVVGESANRHGIGTKLEVTPRLGGPKQIREVGVRSHFLGQSELTEHFGMGADASSIDRVAVTWPTTGIVTVLQDVPANSTIVIYEGRDGYEVLDSD